MDELTKQQNLVSELQAELNRESKKLQALQEQDAEERSPFKIGDIVEYMWGNQWRRARITRIRPAWTNSIHHAGINIRADGSDGAFVDFLPDVRKPE